VADKEIEAIAAMVVMAADMAVLDGQQDGSIRTKADSTRVAVTAAIECAVRNGLVSVVPNLEERMREGVTIRWEQLT
jgi:hypothetical protein